MSLKDRLISIRSALPQSVNLIAVSKTQPSEAILEAYQCGQLVFGENKPQELVAKASVLPSDIQWHLIGHLQTNKVKMVLPYVSMIHSVDSLKLLIQIEKEAAKIDKKVNCLLQFHIATEESKFGLSLSEAEELLKSADYLAMNQICICGVMGMASFSEDEELVRSEFLELKDIFHHLKQNYFIKDEHFSELSMGMSGDYLIAIESGSTLVRIGSAIFGYRS